ncbi:MAG: hypothetical protein Kapaf2KO_19750 [Candidatus Kapaibacteriales bacterium]
MKRIIRYILLFISALGIASALDPGKYSNNHLGLAGVIWTFNEDNTFHYYNWTDLAEWFGEGIYKVKGDTVYIEFDSHPNPLVNTFKIDSIPLLSDNYIHFEIVLLDLNEEPVFGGVSYVSDFCSKRDTGNYGTTIDIDGKGSFRIPKPDSCFILNVRSVEFGEDQIVLSEKYNYSVKYYLSDDPYGRIRNQRDTILITNNLEILWSGQKMIYNDKDTIGFIHFSYKNFPK